MIEVKNIKKSYRNFSLEFNDKFEKGYVYGILGVNGSGKTTLFKSILNLIHLDSGKILINGKENTALTIKDKEKISACFADSDFGDYAKIKEISFVLKKAYKNFNEERFLEKCRQYNLPLNKSLKTFSNGMRAALKVICATYVNSDIILLDEPTLGMDVIRRNDILNLIKDYMDKDSNRICLISSHIGSDIENLCDKILLINDGKLVFKEEMDIIDENYGIIKLEIDKYENIDKKAIVKISKEKFGYRCITNNRGFYLENYKDTVVEKSSIDDIIEIMVIGDDK